MTNVLSKLDEKNILLPSVVVTIPSKTNKRSEILLNKASIQKSEPNDEQAKLNSQEGWVIQFEANKQEVNRIKAIDKYSAIGELYSSEKVGMNKVKYHCIVSKRFLVKKEALDALKKSGLSGWITASSTFSNVTAMAI